MTDSTNSLNSPPPPQPPTRRWFSLDVASATLAKWIALGTTALSLAIPATEFIRSFTAQRLKTIESESNLRIKETEERSKLAVTYLERLTAPNLTAGNRLMLLSALSQLEGHPLQPWANDQRKSQAEDLNLLKELQKKLRQSSAAELSAQSELDQIDAEIQVANLKVDLATSDVELETARALLSALKKTRNGLSAASDLSKLLEEYQTVAQRELDDGYAQQRKSTDLSSDESTAPMVVLIFDRLKYQNISAAAAKIAGYSRDDRTKASALRLAALSAWDAEDSVSAMEIESEASDYCRDKRGSFRVERDCFLLRYGQVVSSFRRMKALGATLEALDWTNSLLSVLEVKVNAIEAPRIQSGQVGAENGLLHMMRLAQATGCYLDAWKQRKGVMGFRATRVIERYKTLLQEVPPPTDCLTLLLMRQRELTWP